MDPEAFLDMANQVTKLKMWPYFDIAHCAMCCLAVREDLGAGSLPFSRKHPIACWLSTMTVVFAGGFLAALFLGEPLLSPFKNTQSVLLATAVWYVMFYSPFDIGYKLAKFLPVKIAIAAMKEIYRCKKVHDGVAHAAKLFPNAWLILLIVGIIKGNGGGFVKIIERLIRGVWTPTAFELLQPSFATKACIVASAIFVLDKKTDFISAPHALVYFGIVIFFVYFKLSSLLLGIHDPFLPFENLFCAVFMGGIWDSMQRAVTGGKGTDASTTAKLDASKTVTSH
uniref:EOG090X09U3 n=1 Tax=Lynceus sp. MCZ IZ 141354 TaxID=1930659 RepID=A0A9N6WSX9_9CRUS|nr:EOG090X09U3 [Lynceus sp. MCZ IZ 141354]